MRRRIRRGHQNKKRYIDLMGHALSAYTDAHVRRCFREVRKEGLTGYGFPRLTANIDVLIANGRNAGILTLKL